MVNLFRPDADEQLAQKSAEWFAARLGKATASRMDDICAKTKTGYSASRENYAVELALEILTQRRTEGFVKAAMQWGIDKEPEARAAYEVATGNFVQEVGIYDHPSIPMSAASPDGLVGDDGLIEIKCPESKQHLRNLISRKPDTGYMLQMQWQMACTGRQWCDFCSYDPRFPEQHQLLIVRVPRDAKLIEDLEKEVRSFRAEVDAIVEKLRNIK
jgi:putative phage-type endonuclease